MQLLVQLVLVIVHKPFLEFLLFAFDQRVLVFHFQLALNCYLIHLAAEHFTDLVVDARRWVMLLELEQTVHGLRFRGSFGAIHADIQVLFGSISIGRKIGILVEHLNVSVPLLDAELDAVPDFLHELLLKFVLEVFKGFFVLN